MVSWAVAVPESGRADSQDWVVGREHLIFFGFNDLIEMESSPACKFERLNSQ